MQTTEVLTLRQPSATRTITTSVAEIACISGLWSTSAYPQWEMARRVAERPTHIIHLPGHNGDPENLKKLRLVDCVAHVQRELQKFPTPPHLIGQSLGGLIAKLARQANPALMRSVVSICGTPPGQVRIPVQGRFIPFLPKMFLGKPFSLDKSNYAFVQGKSQGLILGEESGSLAWEVLWDRPNLYRMSGPPMIDFIADNDQFLPLHIQKESARITGYESRIVWDADHMWHCNPDFIDQMRRVFEWCDNH